MSKKSNNLIIIIKNWIRRKMASFIYPEIDRILTQNQIAGIMESRKRFLKENGYY